jgi:formamidopyrimidine-DNA glycosylase
MAGRCFTSVARRGKNIVLRLDPAAVLLINLGMTGRLVLGDSSTPVSTTHPAIRFYLDRGRSLVFDDMRRFGVMERLTEEEWRIRSKALGPEPLAGSFTAAVLGRGLSTSRSPIRSWLLDQRRLAGVGNIYANEALYRAGVDPRRPARSLDAREVAALHREIRSVLRGAIRARGTTLRDYRDSQGGEGGFGPLLEVYGRDGELCSRCKGRIRRIVFGNRSAFVCPDCQR